MIKTVFAAILTSIIIGACASQDATPEAPLKPVKSEKQEAPLQKLSAASQACPSQIDLRAYRNMMPGPGFDRTKVSASIALIVHDGTGWAVAHKETDREDIILLTLFYTGSRHVKPPARALSAPKQIPGQKPSTARRASFAILKNTASQVEVSCRGNVIAQTRIGAVH